MATPGVTRISGYDGSSIWGQPGSCLFEIGSYIGQGVAGTVYECTHVASHVQYAIKILHPLGYKINSPIALKKFHVLLRGRQYDDSSKANKFPLVKEDVWWLLNSSSKTYIPAYFSSRETCLKELSLNQCMDIWGAEPPEADAILDTTDQSASMEAVVIPLTGQKVYLPKLPPKYLEFVRQRKRIFREINNMRKMSSHPNIIKLEGVLELVQESKDVIFLVMELANAGELFDRIKVDNGAREETAKFFFRQLVVGVKHCHDQGVCHRDLKPENLLLQDTNGGGDLYGFILKIADFGLSTRFLHQSESNQMTTGTDSPAQHSMIRELKSVVGSPHYVAPEVLQERGYDGTKADIWSLGVILYAMLAGSLPFDSNMQTCPRYSQFCKWILANSAYEGVSLWNYNEIEYPSWFFGPQFSSSANGLIVSMLNPDPLKRITINDVFKHSMASRSAHASSSDLHAAILQSYNVGEESKSSASSPDRNSTLSGGGGNNNLNISNNSSNSSSSSANKSMTASSLSEENDHFNYLEGGGGDGGEISMNHSSSEQKHGHRKIASTLDFEAISLEDCSNDMTQSPQLKQQQQSNDSDLMFEMEDDDFRSSSSNSNRNVPKSNSMNNISRNAQVTSLSSLEPPVALAAGVAFCGTPSGDMKSDATFSRMARIASRERNGFAGGSTVVHMSGGNKPPLAPQALTNATPANTIDDLITSDDESHGSIDSVSSVATSSDKNLKSSKPQPPSFVDSVKRSTRFITAVSASDVLDKMDAILESCRVNKSATPFGYIGKVVVNWEAFSIEVYDCSNISMCAIHIYQLPAAYSSVYSSSPVKASSLFGVAADSPASKHLFGSPIFTGDSYMMGYNSQPDLFLVEFARNHMEIFAFKRFYMWIRQQVSALVKRDYAITLFDQHGGSPHPNSKYLKDMHRLS